MNSNTQKKVIVVGSHGHAKVVIDTIESEGKCIVAGLVDDFRPAGEMSLGYPVIGRIEDLPTISKEHECERGVVAVGDNWQRHLIVERIRKALPAFEFVTIVHPSAYTGREVFLGQGTVVMPGAIVNADSKVGDFCLVYTNASLDHDSEMNDFSSLAPGATTGGHVRIGAFSAIAIGAKIINDRTIGEHAVVGAGTVVVEDIPDRCVAYGVPARVVRNRTEGENYL